MSTSLIVPVRGRTDRLETLVASLADCDPAPDERVVARMGGPSVDAALAGSPVPVRIVEVEGEELPLSAARNRGAEAAEGQVLVFLDVDCLPDPVLFGEYEALLPRIAVLAVGRTRHQRPEGGESDRQAHRFETRFALGDDHENFWSLNFAVPRDTFLRQIGGFDEGYRGYGIEDTDFALRAREAHVPLAWSRDAGAVHRHHPPTRFDPAGIAALIGNVERYRQRWERWPAEGWLRELDQAGLLVWRPEEGLLRPA